jgi:hypothetical protein
MFEPRPEHLGFQPYYQRFLDGDIRAIEEYYNENSRPNASFYELIGRLFFLRHHRVVKDLLAGIEHATKITAVEFKRPAYVYWYDLLLPLCQSARKFIREGRRSFLNANRNKLWRDYFSKLPNDNQAELCGWLERYTEASVRSDLGSQGYRGKTLQSMTRSEFHGEKVDRFSRSGLVSPEIFFDLAKTHPNPLTPAVVARRYASWIADISESSASRKTVRK